MTNTAYSVYNVEPIGEAQLPFVVIAFGDQMGYTSTVEWYVCVPNNLPYFVSGRIKYTGNAWRSNVDQPTMLQEAITQAVSVLWSYSRKLDVRFGDSPLQRPALRETNRNFFDCYNLRASGHDHLSRIYAATRCKELKESLGWLVEHPPAEIDYFVDLVEFCSQWGEQAATASCFLLR